MNFYKDPLLEKLRLIESQILGEALSDEEFVELQRLRAELADDPEASKLHADVDAVVTARARDLEKTGQTDPNKPPVDPAKKKPKYLVNPGTRAFQHWLNSKGFKVAVDGASGPETMAARQAYFNKYVKDRPVGTPASDAMADEYFEMSGVGMAYNVKPNKNDEGQYTWLGSKRYLAAMNKYGYDPKTGNPIGGGPAKPAGMAASPTNKLTPAEIEKRNAEIQGGKDIDSSGNTTTPAPASTNPEIAKIDAEIKRFTSGGNNMSLQANKDYVANLEKKKAALAAAPAAQTAKTGPNGEPMTKNNRGQSGYWAKNGRSTNFVVVPTAESTELDRLKQLLKF